MCEKKKKKGGHLLLIMPCEEGAGIPAQMTDKRTFNRPKRGDWEQGSLLTLLILPLGEERHGKWCVGGPRDLGSGLPMPWLGAATRTVVGMGHITDHLATKGGRRGRDGRVWGPSCRPSWHKPNKQLPWKGSAVRSRTLADLGNCY